MLGYLSQANTSAVMPIVRIPMTATYYLGIVTHASKNNFDRFEDLGKQYRE